MSSSNTKLDIERRFGIKDPILTTLIESVDAYQEQVQNELLLSAYAQRSDDISDGFHEVLRRHLFGQMFPGPAFAIAEASLRNADAAKPTMLEPYVLMRMQDKEGNTVRFAPQRSCWIVPTLSNDVQVKTSGSDLLLGFSIVANSIEPDPQAAASIFTGSLDLFSVERLRCRLPEVEKAKSHSSLPPAYSTMTPFFTPFDNRFLELPFRLITQAENKSGGTIWIPFTGLATLEERIADNLKLNAFPIWNLIEEQDFDVVSVDSYRYRVSIGHHATKETIITKVEDTGGDPPIEYMNAATALDPAYPYQFTSVANNNRDEILLALAPSPHGSVRVSYVQYDRGNACVGKNVGTSLELDSGIEQNMLTGIRLATPTFNLETFPTSSFGKSHSKLRLWEYFRSLIASRNRWLTCDDIANGILSFPAFSENTDAIVKEKITFTETVGRKGFLTPFTDIQVPLRDLSLFDDAERNYFERVIGRYVKSRTVNGNFIRVRLVKA